MDCIYESLLKYKSKKYKNNNNCPTKKKKN